MDVISTEGSFSVRKVVIESKLSQREVKFYFEIHLPQYQASRVTETATCGGGQSRKSKTLFTILV
jgi:hypothetical protein